MTTRDRQVQKDKKSKRKWTHQRRQHSPLENRFDDCSLYMGVEFGEETLRVRTGRSTV